MSVTKRQKRVIIACIAVMLLLGLYYTWSVFSNALVTDYGWSYSAANLPYTFSVMFYAVFIFLFGFYYEKFGPKITLITALTMMLLGLLGSSLFFTEGAVAVCYGILYGGGSSGCYTAAISTLMKWAPADRRSLFSGLATGAYGLAGVYTAMLVNYLVKHSGAQTAFFILAVTVIPLILICTLFICLPPREHVSEAKITGAQADVPLRQAIKGRFFWQIISLYLLGCAGGNAIISNISNIASLQCGVGSSFYFVSIMSACNCAGRLVGGILGDRFSKKKVLAIATGIDAVCLLLFRSFGSVPLLLAGTFVVGFAFGCEMSLLPTLITDRYGVTYYSEIYGAVIFGSIVSSFIGPQLAGKLADISGSFYPAYILCAIYLAITCLLTALLPVGKDGQNNI